MWSHTLGAGKGRKNANTHFFEITEHIRKSGEYFMIEFKATSFKKDGLSWKLKDSDECLHDLPYFFKNGELKQFYIIVDGATEEYAFEYIMKVWPKELPQPIAKYFSISTVELKPRYGDSVKTRLRRKGEEEWTKRNSPRITFDRCDEIYEVQLYYQLPNEIIIHSPTLDVECMWNHFDIEKESHISQEKFVLNKIFEIKLNADSFYETEYIATMRLLDPIDHEDYNKEVEIQSLIKNSFIFNLVSGARYEFKLNLSKPQLSISRTFEAPRLAPIDENLWTTLFGTADHATFTGTESKIEYGTINWVSREQEWKEKNIVSKELTIYKHGTYSYKSTFQLYANSTKSF
eukprot:TRINITY_DN11207_c0_g1_i1.p1 TRINITY_DN11207_c0_g1~~TRINITY_DN11207_c0_g1_i1.p1  ORF type:complete len:347 (+),score=13.89 TRINITY_DN11207_c0_g1_i1:30-1070(+)